MALRTAHGSAGKRMGGVRIEVLPADELPDGIPAPPAPAERPEERDAGGRFVKGSKTAQANGGRTRKKTVKLTRKMGLLNTAMKNKDFVPYLRAADAARRLLMQYLAASVGGGECGPMGGSLITFASWQTAAGTYFFEKAMASDNAAMAKTASAMLSEARQNLLAAYEVTVRTAGVRAKNGKDALFMAQQEFQKKLNKYKESANEDDSEDSDE